VDHDAVKPDLDARSDLYSLGATAYFLLTGKPAFERATPSLVITAHLRDPVTPPHYLRTDIPMDLSAVIKRCLEKDPAERYPDAASLEKALGECKCASRWTEERAAEANLSQTTGNGDQRISTTGLERQWGF
jgi:serine/threonine-protein kinase